MMSKKDFYYVAIALMIILAGLAVEKDFYSIGAIIAALLAASSDLIGWYKDADDV